MATRFEGDKLSIAIIGGGIGGIASALGEVGAGIQLSPNATRLLIGLGLGEQLIRVAVRPLAWHQRRWDDERTLLQTPLGEAVEATVGAQYYQIHRAELLAVLATELPDELPDPAGPARPLTTFNYFHRSARFGNVLQQNAVTGIRLGEGSAARLTALGGELADIVGREPFALSFFSSPETFESAVLTVHTKAF